MSEAAVGAPARASLALLAGRGWRDALAARVSIPALAAAQAGVNARDFAAWRDSVLSRSVSLTLLAGSGTRWQSSLTAARAAGRLSGARLAFDPVLPRGLFPVRDFLRKGAAPQGGTSGSHGGGADIPIAAYSIAAVSGLASHVVVVRGYEAEIRRDIIGALGLGAGTWRFATQDAPYGKPLGHGDAAWQCRALWREADWVVANFGGDANSRFTVEASLLALAALNAAGGRDDAAAHNADAPSGGAAAPGVAPARIVAATAASIVATGATPAHGAAAALDGIDFLLPAALVVEPPYPIELDDAGRPLSFGHAKLQGNDPGAGRGPGWTGLANVGLRLYRASALAAVLEELHDRYWVEGKGYAIPGNAEGSGECALDNADAIFAARGRARVLAISRPQELSPVKSFDDIPRFESAASEVSGEFGEG